MPDILRTNSNIETNSRAGRFKPCKYSEVKLKTNTHNIKLYANAVLKKSFLLELHSCFLWQNPGIDQEQDCIICYYYNVCLSASSLSRHCVTNSNIRQNIFTGEHKYVQENRNKLLVKREQKSNQTSLHLSMRNRK
jgi:hypothetical protein